MPVIQKQLVVAVALALLATSAQNSHARGDMEAHSERLSASKKGYNPPVSSKPVKGFHFSNHATSHNGLSVARTLDSAVKALWESGDLTDWEKYELAKFGQALGKLEPGQLGAALEQLAGTQNANLASATQNSQQQLSATLLAAMCQLSDTPSDESRLWLQGLGNSGQLDSQHGSTGLQQRTQGLLLGADWAVDHAWRIGVTGGKSSSDLSTRHFKGAIDSWHLGGYAVRQDGPFALRLGALYSDHAGQNRRGVDLLNYREQLKGSYNATSQNAFAEFGYQLDHGTLKTEPFASLGYQRYHRDRFKETGGYTALDVHGQTQQNMNSILGLRLAGDFPLDNQMSLQPHLSASWKHLYGEVDSSVRQSSAWARRADFNSDFTVQGTALDRDTLALRTGLDLALSSEHTLGVAYTAALGSNSRSQGLTGQWRIAF
ncbi:MAG: Extracellular serine protease [Pseudomonas fluorescens]|nr:MAG: Extracellular serine protease [Pseudomonas fluorescens]